jgi:hypothetical protein
MEYILCLIVAKHFPANKDCELDDLVECRAMEGRSAWTHVWPSRSLQDLRIRAGYMIREA